MIDSRLTRNRKTTTRPGGCRRTAKPKFESSNLRFRRGCSIVSALLPGREAHGDRRAARGRRRPPPGPADFHPRRRPDHLRQLRGLPPSGRGGPVQPAHLRRRPRSARADRRGHAAPLHAAVAARARPRRLRRGRAGSATRRSRSCSSGATRGPRRGTPRTSARAEVPRGLAARHGRTSCSTCPSPTPSRAGRHLTSSATSSSRCRSAAARYVRALEILPGNRRSSTTPTSSWTASGSRGGATRGSRARLRRHGRQDGIARASSRTATSSSGSRGTPPSRSRGMAWRLDPGTDLVLNMHLKPSGKPETVRPRGRSLLHRPPPTQIPDAAAARARRRARHPRRRSAISWSPTS